MMEAGMNVLMLFLLIASVEMLHRSLSEPRERLFGIDLYPRQWGAIVAQQQAVLANMAQVGSYLYDEREGWTIAPSYSGEHSSSRETPSQPSPRRLVP